MIIRDYAAPQRLGFNMDAPCPAQAGWPHVLVWGGGERVAYREHLSGLTLRVVRSGEEQVRVGAARYAVRPGSYLLLNEAQPHAHAVDEASEVVMVVMRPGFLAEVKRSLTAPAEVLLGAPNETTAPTFFFERIYPQDPLIAAHVQRLGRVIAERDLSQDGLEHAFYPIATRLLALHLGVQQEVARLPAVRRATKEELYRRLYRARDYIEACFQEPLDLKRMAGVAELSPHHFLRLFKRVFGETPHKYLTRLRLERAQNLLQTGERSVTDVCFDVGFESLGSFSSLFKKHTGVAPSRFGALAMAGG